MKAQVAAELVGGQVRGRRKSGVQAAVTVPKRRAPESMPAVWCECSAAYEAFATSVTDYFAADAVRLARMGPSADVLDVAAGTGAFTMAAARRGARVLATDFSPAMIRRLQRKCGSLSYQNVQTALMDGQDLELPDARFDVAASLFGLMFFPDHRSGLRELHRVLRPGGQVLVSVWAPPARVELMRLLGDAVMTAGIEPAGGGNAPYWLELCDTRCLCALLREVGFRKIHVVAVSHVAVFDTVDEFIEILPIATPSSAALVRSMSSSERRRFDEALAESFLERQGDGPYAVTNEALIAVGTK